jgi:predicted transcriptional regulator
VPKSVPALSRRERQIMDVLYRRTRATAAEVMAELPDPPSYSAVRSALRLLVEKGHLTRELEDLRYVYRPRVPRDKASRSAVSHLVRTFFDGSRAQAMAAILESADTRLSNDELDRLARLVEQARQDRRP